MPLQWPRQEVLNYLKFLMVSKMAKIKITQTRSAIKRPKDQRRTILALGLGKVNRTVEVEATPQIMGMVNKVSHLVSVSE
jgi:large subunit ribosomal protein L30